MTMPLRCSAGEVTNIEVLKDGINEVESLDGIYSVTVGSDGKNVYNAGYNDNAVPVGNRNFSTGTLSYLEDHEDDTGEVDGLYGAISVTVSPDGKNVYLAGEEDDAVAVLNRTSSIPLVGVST